MNKIASPKQIAFRKRLIEELKLSEPLADELEFEKLPTAEASKKLDALIKARDEQKESQ